MKRTLHVLVEFNESKESDTHLRRSALIKVDNDFTSLSNFLYTYYLFE